MNYKNTFWKLVLFFASIKAQSCNQPTSFTLKIFGQSDSNILLYNNGSIFDVSPDNSNPQLTVLCKMTDAGNFDALYPQALCLKKSYQQICSSFSFAKANGNIFLQCFDLINKNPVSIIGFDTNTGFVPGNPTDPLQQGQVAVNFKTNNDPCGLIQNPPLLLNFPPLVIPKSPPSTGKQGEVCGIVSCQPGLCCTGVMTRRTCQKCSSQGVPKPTPPKPTPPKPASGSCDGKTGKGCKFVDCAADGDCPSGMSCVAPEESGDSKVCYPTSTELGTERKLLGGNVGSYTESMASGDLNQFAAYDFAAKFAFAIYSGAKEVSSGLCSKYTLVKFTEATPFFVAVGIYQSGDHVVVAFRGTVNDIRGGGNWLANLNILPDTWGGGTVASGFLQAYESFNHWVTNTVGRLNPKSITVTGHSLGGALSQLAVLDLLSKKFVIDSHITFGMPHVGDERFQRDYESKMGSIRKAHFVAQSPKGKIDIVTEVSPTFSPIPGKLTIPVKRLGYISLHAGYQSTFDDWESKHLKSSGKCVNFNSASSSAPPPGPSHGSPTPPKGQSPASGPKCNFKH